MKIPIATTLCLLAAAAFAGAAPRIALVRVADIYKALPATAALKTRLESERAEIMKNERAEQLRKIISDLQALQDQLSSKDKPLDEGMRTTLARAYEVKRQEAQSLQEEFENYRKRREKEINAKMVADMRATLDGIAAASRKIGKERGYELVLDSSGDSNTSEPFVLYSKDAPDLTADVQAALADSTPPKAKPVSQPKAKRR